MSEEQKFPSEVVDLPSEGKVYPKDHPLASGKVELKYMTAREEDILTSQNLIKKGLVIDKLLNALILTENVTLDDMVVGDKNAIMVAARILAYGPEYPCQIPNPDTGQLMEYTFNLAECPFKKIDTKITGNTFQTTLPVSKKKVKSKPYNPTARLKDYQEAIQILMVDYADVWEKTGTFKEVDKKLKMLGI